MKFRLHHATRYSYGSTVDLASHMLHLTPRAFAHQRVISNTIASDPQPGRRTNGVDHFGNGVTWMFLERPHTGFSVICEALVDVHFPDPPAADATPAWEDVARLAREGRAGSQHEDAAAWQAAEYIFDSPMLPHEPLASDYARASFAPGRPVLAALLELNTRIRTEFRFRAGVTTISTPVREVMAKRDHVAVYVVRAVKRVPGMRRVTPAWRRERRKVHAVASVARRAQLHLVNATAEPDKADER